MANTYELIVKTVDQTSRPLRNMQQGLGRLEKSARGVRVALGAVASAAAAIASANVLRGIISQYREYERYQTVLTTFLGSQQAANAELQRLQQIANTLPQDLQDITNAFTILSRFGIDTSSESLRAFSNIATANARSLSQLGEAVADALTGEFERLKEFGIRVARENGQFIATIGSQQVAVASSTTDLVNQLKSLGEEGGRFGGAAAANANTLDQAYSNLNGAIFETAVAFGQALKPALRETVNLTSQLLRDNQELAAALGAGTGAALRALSDAFGVLAANITIVRDALLLLIFTRIARSVATLVSRIAQFTSGAKSAAGFASGLSKAIGAVGTSVGTLVGRLTGIGPLLATIASFTPVGRAIAIGIAAASAAMFIFRDSTLQLGDTTTTVSEIVRAFAFKAGQWFRAAADTLGAAWSSAINQVTGFFDSLGIDIGAVFTSIGGFTLDVVNAMIGYFVLANKSIVAIFTTLPQFFADLFVAIGSTASEFQLRFIEQFKSLGEAVKLALIAPFSDDTTFQDALDALTTNAFSGFLESVKENFTQTGTDITAALQEVADSVTYDYIENGLDAVGDAVESTVVEFRAYQQAIVAAEAATRMYDDAALRLVRGLGVVGAAVDGAGVALSQYEQFLANANNTIGEGDAAIATLTATINSAINAFSSGAINAQQFASVIDQVGAAADQASLDILTMESVLANAVVAGQRSAEQSQLQSEALEYLNQNYQSLGLSGEALRAAQAALGMEFETVGRGAAAVAEEVRTVETTLRDALKSVDDFRNGNLLAQGAFNQLENAFGRGEITLKELGIAMNALGVDFDNIKTNSIQIALEMSEAFAQAGDGLARGLARGISRGENIMSSFKDFMSSILEEILYQVIQQAFISPLISNLQNGLNQAFGALSAGGGGLGNFFGGSKGGGMGFLGSIFGAIGGLFFANGGVVPGSPTSGDSVPIMATPGEVILNKRQQEALLNGGNGEQVSVTFQINAIDTRNGTEFIMQQRDQITGLIQQAYRQRGQSGPLG